MKSVLLIIPAATKQPAKLASYVETLAELTSAPVRICPADEISVVLAPGQFEVYDHHNDCDLRQYDLIIFRGLITRLYLASVICNYLAEHNVRFFNDYRDYKSPNKLLQAVQFYQQGVHFPKIVYIAQRDLLRRLIERHQLMPVVVKSVAGSKGQDNYLIGDDDGFNQIAKQPDSVSFFAQQYIPCDGDYRILFFGDELVVRLRQGGELHLHNHSQGATIQSVPSSVLPPQALAEAKQLVRHSGLTIAGVDLVIDSTSGNFYFLEINAQPGWGKLKDDIRPLLKKLLGE